MIPLLLLTALLSLPVAAEGYGDPAPLPALPERAAPAGEDMDAKGYADKVTFYAGQPVLIIRTGDAPEVQPFPVDADGVLVAPTYLSFLEKRSAWSEGAEQYLELQAAACDDQVARVEWMLKQTETALAEERKPVPVMQLDWVKFASGALVGTAAVLTAGWALGQVNGGQAHE